MNEYAKNREECDLLMVKIRNAIIIINAIVYGELQYPEYYNEQFLKSLEEFITYNFENCFLGQGQLSKLYQVINYYRFEKQYEDSEMRERCFHKCNDMIACLNQTSLNVINYSTIVVQILADHGIFLNGEYFDFELEQTLRKFSYCFEQDLSLFFYLTSSRWSGTHMNELIMMKDIECSIYYLVLLYGHLLSEEQLARALGLLLSRDNLICQRKKMSKGKFIPYTLNAPLHQQGSAINCRLSYEEYQQFLAGSVSPGFWQEVYDMVKIQLDSKKHPELDSETLWHLKQKRKSKNEDCRRNH